MFSKRLIFALLMVVIMVSSFGLDARAAGTVNIDWVRQFGSVEPDRANATVSDSSGVYVAGFTTGVLPGQTHLGSGGFFDSFDAYVRKYDHNGLEVWTHQFGTVVHDTIHGIAVDNSGVYVAGYTLGALPGQTSSGGSDIFVRKYDQNGAELWTRQFGSSQNDYLSGITSYGSNIFITGNAHGSLPGQTHLLNSDAYVSAFDQDGNVLWTRQFGTVANEIGMSVAADASGIYVGGVIYGASLPGQTALGGADIFLRKYDLNGSEVWTTQYGTNQSESPRALAIDGSGVFVAGETSGAFPGYINAGGYDGYVSRFTANGDELWTSQFGTTGSEFPGGAAVDGSGVIVSGSTDGTLPGQISSGYSDVFVLKVDLSGSQLWTSQFGTSSYEFVYKITIDNLGLLIAGDTAGSFPGESQAGNGDAFIARLTFDAGNQAPTAQAGGPYSGTEGSAISLDGSASSDPDADSLDFSWSVDSALCAFSDAALVSPSLTCEQDGSFTVSLEVSDGQESHSATASVLVSNAAPVLGLIAAPIDPVQVNTSIAASAAFTDAGTLDTHTAAWDWGDGSTTTGSVSESGGAGSVSDSHTYTAPGVYTLALTVSDLDGGNAVVTHQYVVVYDPSSGFVTGAGFIQSPLGACQQLSLCEDVEGRARFGFVSKYQKGANVPTGNTQFRFDAGGFIFESDTYDWLVVNQGGTNAQFKGSGLVNDQLAPNGAAFRFMIWAGDGTGAGGADTFRIKIWYDDGGTEVVVYDNGTNQPISGGQIRVHK